MQTHDLTPHLETLRKGLSGKPVDEDDLKQELEKYLAYGVPPEQAVRTILRHHGVVSAPTRSASVPVTNERIPIAELPPASPSVNLLARILTLNTKDVQARGETKQVVWGLLGDETGSVAYTSWRPLEGVQKGDVLAIEGAYTKEYNGQPQVNFGDRTRLTARSQDDLPKAPTEMRDVDVASLRDGLRGIRVTGRILTVEKRQVQVQGQPKDLWSGTFADATGSVAYTCWSDLGLTQGQAVTIEGGYIRSFRNQPQLTFDQDAKLTAATGVPEESQLREAGRPSLDRLIAAGGGSDLHVRATLLEVRPGSGLVLRCGSKDAAAGTSCSRVLVGGQCRIHGRVEGTPDLRIKGVLDDGTGAVMVVVGREATETLLGKTLEESVKKARDAFRPEIIQDDLRDLLTGRVFDMQGNAVSDEYGIMFIARTMQRASVDTQAGAKALLEVA